MEIERLNELKSIVEESTVGGYSDFTIEDDYDFNLLINAEIERQSVTDQDITEAIDHVKYCHWVAESEGQASDDDLPKRDLAITALRQMQSKEENNAND